MKDWNNWREYQEAVAAVFRRLGYSAEIEQRLDGARGRHKVDVFVTFKQNGIESKWVVECKLWNSPVKKSDVITLQGIVADIGADRGILFSETGFQSGGENMTKTSNITLVSSLSDFIATAHAEIDTTRQQIVQISQTDGGPPILRLPGDRPRPQYVVCYQESILVGDWGTGSIYFIDPRERTIDAKVQLDRYETQLNRDRVRKIRNYVPGRFVLSGEKLFLAQVFSEFLLVIDIPTYSIVKRIQVPGGGEGALAASSDGLSVFFASNKSNALYVIDTQTYVTTEHLYPQGGRGSMSVALSGNESVVYVGIQRGYNSGKSDLLSGGCFLAIFDRAAQTFTGVLPLYEPEQGRADVSIPACILPDCTSDRVYVGMFQGRAGINLIGTNPLKIIRSSGSQPNKYNVHFKWVDPLAMGFYQDKILAIFRNNRELVMLDRETLEVQRRLFLGDSPNGPNDLAILGDKVVITYPERGGIIILDFDVRTIWQ